MDAVANLVLSVFCISFARSENPKGIGTGMSSQNPAIINIPIIFITDGTIFDIMKYFNSESTSCRYITLRSSKKSIPILNA